MSEKSFAISAEGYQQLVVEAARSVALGVRFPDFPFVSRAHLSICDVFWSLDDKFGEVLSALANASLDDEVIFVGLQPDPAAFAQAAGWFPAFRVPRVELPGGYGSRMRRGSSAQSRTDLFTIFDNFVISGSSDSWSVVADRAYGLAVVNSDAGPQSWRGPFDFSVDASDALEGFVSPGGFPRVNREARPRFLGNFGDATA